MLFLTDANRFLPKQKPALDLLTFKNFFILGSKRTSLKAFDLPIFYVHVFSQKVMNVETPSKAFSRKIKKSLSMIK